MRMKRVFAMLALVLALGVSGSAGWIGIELSHDPDPGWGAD
jgi:hypothetical protein